MEFFKNIRSLIFSKKISLLSKKNSIFLLLVLTLIIIISPSNFTLQWVGLSLAMFSTMTNDSIQTLGTFLSSNSKEKWWKMWIYVGILFLITILVGWFLYNHRLDFKRLYGIQYDPSANIMHFIAPILLIILTCNKIPVSTTFLILSVFTTQDIMTFMLVKTILGYFIAFAFSFIIWYFLLKFFKKIFEDFSDSKIKKWRIFQWISTGMLWIIWLIQNTSNIVVYIPRRINIYSLILIIMLGIVMIGFTIYNKGGPIQEIVDEKTDMSNIHYTAMINFSFAIMIALMTCIGTIPIATTWMFIGILGGRELAIAKYETNQELSLKDRYKIAEKKIFRDLVLAGLGIAISLSFYMINTTFDL
ncbi:MAG TPA: hypothetical protein VLL98_03655 [Rickettsiales bacterium]|nr:hypothetical protein [Rickettsiales bacterium]